ncbi:MAG: HNH endonuclease [Coriobacteriia bacterium]|nr:HNH endonuclease [Coriobacteriia bacterium]
MRGFVANTDFDWFTFLRAQEGIDEVNFWQPSKGGGFTAEPGTPFFFRLKSPYNAIGGFGYVAKYSRLPAWLAWEAFRAKNGAQGYPEMKARIDKYRRRNSGSTEARGEGEIGCIMIASPIFFSEDQWVADLADWQPNIVRGRYQDLMSGEGLRLFTECMERAARVREDCGSGLLMQEAVRYGEPVPVRPRLGQGTFRIAVIDAYDRCCSITGEHSLPVIDAAHIMPYADGGVHDVSNGLALRSDIHRLFDLGYVTVTPDYRFRVGDALREDYNNGRSYYRLDGREMALPVDARHLPERQLLDWHGQAVFKG